MARANQKSDFVSGMGAGFEFVKAISDAVQKRGGGDADLRKVMADPRLADQIAEIIMAGKGLFPSLALATDLILNGWVVVEDIEPTELQNSSLELVPFLRDTDDRRGCIDGTELRKRGVDLKANKGLVDAKRMLERQAEIPVEFRNYYLVFTGTVLRGPDGRLYVPCLVWDGGRWCLDFGWLGRDWSGRGRLVRCK